MKKIIELAKKVCSTEGFVDDNILKAIEDLDRGLVSRRKLETTPITEDWLKEHGFVLEPDGYVYYDDSKGTHEQYYACVQLRHSGGARRIEIKTMWRSFCAEQGTFGLSYLLDAMELCGITMKD